MPKIQLNPTQKQAVETTTKKFPVVASAGAGKTQVLVERYLHLITDHQLTPDQIITVTFTKKAAAEMKERIVARLKEIGRPEDAQSAETGPISTIHSLCERLLRENSLAAGLDPTFEVIEGFDHKSLIDNAFQDALLSGLPDQPHIARFLQTHAGATGYQNPGFVDRKVKDIIFAFIEKLRESTKSYDELSEIYQSPSSLISHALSSFYQEFPDHPQSTSDEDLTSWISLSHTKSPRTQWASKKVNPQQELVAAENACAVAQLALHIWANLEDTLLSQNYLDYNLLQRLCLDLLINNPEVRIRIQNQYQAVLIDETQDVNPIQFNILDSLALTHELMVGDAQQSIYGFRGADPEAFRRKCETTDKINLKVNYRSTPQLLQFINDFFANLWKDRYQPMSTPPDDPMPTPEDPNKYQGIELWPSPSQNLHQAALNIQELIAKENIPPSDIACLINTADQAVTLSNHLVDLNIPCIIDTETTRFYTGMEARDLANALIAVTDPTDDFALAATLLSPFVELSLDSVTILTQNEQASEQLQEFDPETQEDRDKLYAFRQWHQDLIQLADRLPAWEVLSELFIRTPYLQNVTSRPNGERLLANIRKMFQIAVDHADQNSAEFAERLRQIAFVKDKEREAIIHDAKEPVVTIMTIHKSKGLQFPVVVLPNLFKPLNRPPMDDLYVDPTTGLCSLFGTKNLSVLQQFLQSKHRLKEEAENQRLLYVAMTRAERRLCLNVISEPKDKPNLASLIRANTNFPNQHPSIKIRPEPTPSQR